MTVQQKLQQIASSIGYPFAVRETISNTEKGEVKGLEAWACYDGETRDYRVSVFANSKDIAAVDSGYWVYNEIDNATHFVNDGEITQF